MVCFNLIVNERYKVRAWEGWKVAYRFWGERRGLKVFHWAANREGEKSYIKERVINGLKNHWEWEKFGEREK